MDDQGVQDGKHHDGPDPQEDLRDHQVGLEHIGVRYVNVLYGLPSTFSCIDQAGGVGAEAPEDHLVLEAEGDVEEDAAEEGEADAQPGVLQRVDPLEVRRLVDGDVPVDRHEDDDVDRAGHEGVDQGHLKVSLPEGVTKSIKKAFRPFPFLGTFLATLEAEKALSKFL